jgi:hypothetical protein
MLLLKQFKTCLRGLEGSEAKDKYIDDLPPPVVVNKTDLLFSELTVQYFSAVAPHIQSAHSWI